MELFLNLIIFFAIYSFIGWIAEVIFVYVTDEEIQNRGFLYGPFLPIYGSGALVALLVNKYLSNNLFLLFFTATFTSTLIEYFVHFILDKFMDVELWNYSEHKYNINGRVCLTNSILFGLGSLALIYLIHPKIAPIIMNLNFMTKMVVSLLIIIYFIVDWTLTLIAIGRISLVKKKYPDMVKYLHHRRSEIDESFSSAVEDVADHAKYKTLLTINTTTYVAKSILKNITRKFKKPTK